MFTILFNVSTSVNFLICLEVRGVQTRFSLVSLIIRKLGWCWILFLPPLGHRHISSQFLDLCRFGVWLTWKLPSKLLSTFVHYLQRLATVFDFTQQSRVDKYNEMHVSLWLCLFEFSLLLFWPWQIGQIGRLISACPASLGSGSPSSTRYRTSTTWRLEAPAGCAETTSDDFRLCRVDFGESHTVVMIPPRREEKTCPGMYPSRQEQADLKNVHVESFRYYLCHVCVSNAVEAQCVVWLNYLEGCQCQSFDRMRFSPVPMWFSVSPIGSGQTHRSTKNELNWILSNYFRTDSQAGLQKSWIKQYKN